MRNIYFNWQNSMMTASWLSLLLLGLTFAFTGLLILLVPEILIAFIAGTFFVIGAMIIATAFRARRRLKEYDQFIIHMF